MRYQAILLCLCLSLSLSACIRDYRAPRADEPHAIVKVRRTYTDNPGPALLELVTLDGDRIDARDSVPGHATTTSAVRVHPRPGRLAVESQFYRTETRMVRERYTEYQTEYYTETYNCGGYGSSRTCRRQASRRNPIERYRTVPKQVRAVVASCSAGVRFAPQEGRLYLMQYSFRADQHCDLRCFEQTPLPNGEFDLSPCPAPTAEP